MFQHDLFIFIQFTSVMFSLRIKNLSVAIKFNIKQVCMQMLTYVNI